MGEGSSERRVRASTRECGEQACIERRGRGSTEGWRALREGGVGVFIGGGWEHWEKEKWNIERRRNGSID
jgi:hypothetical protein